MPKVIFEKLIISESENWIILNKPSGMITESNPFEQALEDHLKTYLTNNKKNAFVGVVHRLDKVTSGLIIFAKKKSILKILNAMIANRQIKKAYQAIVERKPNNDSATLVNQIEKDIKSKKAIIHAKSSKNTKEAKLENSVNKKTHLGYLLNIDLYTGRFHQIRAQLAHIKSPIVGDSTYEGIKHKQVEKGRILLHANKLNFPKNEIGLPSQVHCAIDLPNESK